jgi:hypothetical protein
MEARSCFLFKAMDWNEMCGKLKGFGVKREGYRCNLDKDQGWKCKRVGWF